jgi:hypothetical protein
MTTSLIIKPEQKRLNRSIHTGVGQTNIRINLAPETGNRAQFARQMPEQRHHGSKRLDRSAEQRQGGREDVLLGECQLILLTDNCESISDERSNRAAKSA